MGAKIYSTPDEIKVPKIDFGTFNLVAYEKQVQEFKNELKTFLLKRKGGKDIGEVIAFPVGDGMAEYMVASLSPLELIHLPLMDEYEFPYAHLLTKEEVVKMLKQQEAFSKLFS